MNHEGHSSGDRHSPFPGVVPVAEWEGGKLVRVGTGLMSNNIVACATSVFLDYNIDDARPHPTRRPSGVIIVGIPRDGGRGSVWCYAAESLTSKRLLEAPKPFLHMPHIDVLQLTHTFTPVPVGAACFDLDELAPLALAECGSPVEIRGCSPHRALSHQPAVAAAAHADLGHNDVLRLVGYPRQGGGALSTSLCRLEDLSIPEGVARARFCGPALEAPGACVMDAHGRHIGVVARERPSSGIVDIALFSTCDVGVLAGESAITIQEAHVEPQEHAHLARKASLRGHSGSFGSALLT